MSEGRDGKEADPGHLVGGSLEALCRVADELRRATVGARVTSVVNRNINFTNACFIGGSFCGFSRHPGAADACALSLAQVVAKAEDAWPRGAAEVCIQGGLPPNRRRSTKIGDGGRPMG